ncbi:MAG TPA: prepilin-type N-terminal cleavage/methylation domain-containing protein [Candidatus Saccharimonadales bacterium]|nr:prepilin-type N-terminal cleavage/methylation domain-containing protein [Candidatus Saccharimonadales bacterium]
MRHTTHNQSGYTLIELLLYVVLVGMVLTTVTIFFGIVVDARIKNQTIGEIDDQGQMIMDTITQTIRNATSITTPASGASSPSLTLVVPTGSLSPTVFDVSGTTMGLNIDGGTSDTSDSNTIHATKIVAGATGTISSLSAYIATVAASPNNLGQMAIYSGTTPTTLLASSSSVALTPNTWNNFTITPVSVTSGQTYWIAYNGNGLASTDNDLRQRAGSAGQSGTVAQAFGTWPASWTAGSLSLEYSVYAMIDAAGTPGASRIKEGAGAAVALSSNDLQVSGLSFQNLTRTGTSGMVRVSFTLTRLNPSNRNEYDYQKTFVSSAEVGW